MGGKGSQTIGFEYYMSLHMGLCRGPINEIVDIWVGGLSAWEGNDPICIPNGGIAIYINKPELFGGNKKEGGIQGPAYIYSGARDQVLQPGAKFVPGGPSSGSLYGDLLSMLKGPSTALPGIAESLGGDVPNFRGVTTIWYNGLVCAMNPYPKEWAFRLRRTTAGWFDDEPWYPEKATIVMEGTDGKQVYGMNAAHILYEVNTNPEWGRGMPADLIDENSFIYAANQLCDEGFGLCLPWFRREAIKEFIPQIINHVAGATYVDRETGKIAFRLIRNDYDPDELPIFGPDSGLLRIEDDDSSSEETAFNEITVTGFDPVRKEDINLSAHNLAAIQTVGEIISNAYEYKGLATRDLVARVAQRELRAQSTGQRRFTLFMDRRAWRIKPAMPFKISWPAKGIGEMIVRGGEIDDNGEELQLKVVQDIYGMSLTSYITPTEPEWTPPNRAPEPAAEEKLFEANYRDMYRRATEAQREAFGSGEGMIGIVAAPPAGVATYSYDIATHGPGEEYETRTAAGYTSRTSLVYDIEPLDTTIWFDLDTLSDFLIEFTDGAVVMIGDEQIGVTTLDEETGEATVKRGVADTLPRAHDIGATVWLVDDEIGTDFREYIDGEVVNAKVLPRTSSFLLPLEDAAELTVTMDQRQFRPYPPGNLKVDGDSVYTLSGSYIEPVLTWAHRDRLVQADAVVGHTEGSVGPETGVTYQIEVFDEEGGTLLNTYDVAGTTWTYTAAMQYDDTAGDSVWMEMVSVRDYIESYFAYGFEVLLGDFLTVDDEIVLIDGEGISF